jgi:hypothetical protein
VQTWRGFSKKLREMSRVTEWWEGDEECKLDSEPEMAQLVRFNVSGKLFSTRKQTIEAFPNSFLSLLTNGRFPNLEIDQSTGAIFIDRPSKPFETILTFLQTGKLYLGESTSEQALLYDEADFYGISLWAKQKVVRWTLKMHSQNVLISNYGLRAAMRDDSVKHGFIVGSHAFNAEDGQNFFWQVKLLRLKGWIMIGILDASSHISQPAFSYGNAGSFGISSLGQVFENGKLARNEETTGFEFVEGDTVVTKLDMAACNLSFEVNGQEVAKCDGLDPKGSYFPHFNLSGGGDAIEIAVSSQ